MSGGDFSWRTARRLICIGPRCQPDSETASASGQIGESHRLQDRYNPAMPLLSARLMLALLLSACVVIPTPSERRAHADALAASHGWRAERLPAGQFELLAYLPPAIRKGTELTIYLEGDGFAWMDASTPSPDPTPRDPLALRLALQQPEGNAAYLGRPCQYVDAQPGACPQRYWTEARFAPEVLAASNQAIDALKARFAAQQLILVGYSGGGAIAALLAARRDDVERLITVAGNLDHRAWTRHHRVTPLTGSLNPADAPTKLQGLRQTHFAGGADRTMPAALVTAFAARFPAAQRPVVNVLPDFDHQCCWEREWPALWRAAMRGE